MVQIGHASAIVGYAWRQFGNATSLKCPLTGSKFRGGAIHGSQPGYDSQIPGTFQLGRDRQVQAAIWSGLKNGGDRTHGGLDLRLFYTDLQNQQNFAISAIGG